MGRWVFVVDYRDMIGQDPPESIAKVLCSLNVSEMTHENASG